MTHHRGAMTGSPNSVGVANNAPYDVIVVGGGMAGLTASAFLSRSGHRVLLCEQSSELGGLVQTFERDGFIWDAGIRALEDSGIIFPMLAQLGIEIDFVKSPVSLGIEDQIIPVESQENLLDYRRLLEHFYPDRRPDIERILRVVRRVMTHMDVLYGIENPLFKDLRTDRAYVFRELLPWLGKFIRTIGKINRMGMPVDEYLETLTDSRALVDIISQHFFRKTPTFFALSYFSLYLDYVYPAQGTGALPSALEAFCIDAGVEIQRETRITAVDLANHSVSDARDRTWAYRKLIWAADLKSLYAMVDVSTLPGKKARMRARQRAADVNAASGGDSVFTLFLASNLEPEWFADRSNGHFFYTPVRHGVGAEVYRELDEILAQASEGLETRSKAEAWIRHYIGSTTYEISIPVLKSPAAAPPGKTGLIISVLFDYSLCAMARTQGWYEDMKDLIENLLIDALDASVYPGLRDAILHSFSSTPLSIQQTAGTSGGAITGWSFSSQRLPAEHRMQHVSRSIKTYLPDVYQAGQWTYSPSGVPIAILTGRLAADAAARGLRKGRWRKDKRVQARTTGG